MMSTQTRPARFGLAVAACLALSMTLAGCSGSSNDAKPAASASPTRWVNDGPDFTTPGPDAALGTQTPSLPASTAEIPEAIHVNTIPEVRAGDMLVTEDHGSQNIGIHVVDAKTGKLESAIDSSTVNFWNITFGIVSGDSGLPPVVGVEDWRPRGLAGAAEHVVSFYHGDLLERDEIALPEDTRLHAQNDSATITSDGKFLVAWDDAVFGVRVVDLSTRKVTGALRLVGCGPFTWNVGHDIYSPCTETGEIVQIHLDDDGVPKVVAKKKVFNDGFVGSRDSGWSRGAKTAVITTVYGGIYVIDLSQGMPAGPIGKVGSLPLAGEESPGAPEVSADGSQFAVPIESGFSTGSVVVYRTKGVHRAYTLAADKFGSIKSIAYGLDGKLYVLTSKSGEMGDVYKLRAFDSTGKQVGVAPLTTTVASTGGLNGLMAPLVLDGK